LDAPTVANRIPSVSLKGIKSGDLYHQNITSFINVVPILGFNFSALQPRDSATGLPTGKSQFSTITLSKEMDVSSPLLLQVMTNNEIFQATIFALEPATSQYCLNILFDHERGCLSLNCLRYLNLVANSFLEIFRRRCCNNIYLETYERSPNYRVIRSWTNTNGRKYRDGFSEARN